METTPKNYIVQLDGFRFIAIAGVFIEHLVKPWITSDWFQAFPFGSGVNLFFVLSGFLITQILLQEREKLDFTWSKAWLRFMFRRTIRIFPIYYITILFLYLIQFQNYKEATPWAATYTTNIYLMLDKPYLGSYSHLWSLAVEEQFYLFWPFVIFFVPRKWLLGTILCTIFVSIGLKFILYYDVQMKFAGINAFTFSCMDALALGALMAWLKRFKPEFYIKTAHKWWLGILVFIIYLFTVIYPIIPGVKLPTDLYMILFNTLFSVAAFFLLIPATQNAYPRPFRWFLENKLVVHLGKISYGLYLFHLFMPDLLNWLQARYGFPEFSPRVEIVWMIVFCIIIAEISWFCIEAPLNKLKNVWA